MRDASLFEIKSGGVHTVFFFFYKYIKLICATQPNKYHINIALVLKLIPFEEYSRIVLQFFLLFNSKVV